MKFHNFCSIILYLAISIIYLNSKLYLENKDKSFGYGEQKTVFCPIFIIILIALFSHILILLSKLFFFRIIFYKFRNL